MYFPDNPEESQDETVRAQEFRGFGYAPSKMMFSGIGELIPRQNLASETVSVGLPVRRLLPGETTASWQTRSAETQPQSPQGIGHRILALGQEQGPSWQTNQPSVSGPKLAIGHRIMRITGEQPNAIPQPWRNQHERVPYLNPQQSPRLQPLTNVGPFKPDLDQHQGIFRTFVPAGARVNGTGAFTGGQSGFGYLHQGLRVGQPILSRSVPAESRPGFFTSSANDPPRMFGSTLRTDKNASSVQIGMKPVRFENFQNSSHIGQQQMGQVSPSTPGRQSTVQQHRQQQQHHGRLPRSPHKSSRLVAPQAPPPPVSDIQTYIRQQAAAYGIPEALALGLVNKESHFDSNARGTLQEVGLFQIRPPRKGKTLVAEDANGKKFTIDISRAASDWQYNVRAGMALLRRAYRQAQASTPNDAIAATYAHYNGGDKNWIYYTRKNAPVHYHIYGQWIKRHGKPEYVEGYMDFYHKWGGK